MVLPRDVVYPPTQSAEEAEQESVDDMATVSQYHGGWSSGIQIEAQHDWDTQRGLASNL